MIRRITAALLVLLGCRPPRWRQGMPQLDFANPLTTEPGVVGRDHLRRVLSCCAAVALPQVGSVLEERARLIAADLETAAGQGEADAAAEQVAEATARARAEAQAAINAALDAAKQQACGAGRDAE